MAEPLKKNPKLRKKTGPKPAEENHEGVDAEDAEQRAETGEPGDMKALGESISGTQPEIGQKDTGVGRRQPPAAP